MEKIKDQQVEVKELRIALSDYLSQYVTLSGSNQIESPDGFVYDIVYMPMNTDLIVQAKKNNATIIYGYEMLLGQAIRSFEIWHGIDAPYNTMKKALLGGF